MEVVSPERERLDACMVFPSMPAVMKLNKLGTFSMSQLGQVSGLRDSLSHQVYQVYLIKSKSHLTSKL